MSPAGPPRQLGRLRFPVEYTRGRRYPEVSHPYRNDFQRDRDRILHARAFRRLENKTQVFGAGASDHFRNRLTHTIEVAQIARSTAAVLDLNEDLTEALALVHDVGHPPFGHAGEDELDCQMRRFGSRFDHNLHALRIVEELERRYVRFPGLNLTFEVREGIVKHSRDLRRGESPDLDEYLPDVRPPLEAQLIDLADEIAYNTSDLDDGYSAQLFTIADVRRGVPEFDRMYEEIEGQFPGAPDRIRIMEVVRGLVDSLASGLARGTIDRAEAAAVASSDAVREHVRRIAGFTPESEATNRQLKQFLHQFVYGSQTLVEERQRSSAMIAELFQYLIDHPAAMPQEYRESFEGAPVHRMVCDWVAGMTDGFFHRTFDSLLRNSTVGPHV